jgi:hypothetical protein
LKSKNHPRKEKEMQEYLKDVAWAGRKIAAIKIAVRTDNMLFRSRSATEGGLGEHYSIGPHGITLQFQYCKNDDAQAAVLCAGAHFGHPDRGLIATVSIIGARGNRKWHVLYTANSPEDPDVTDAEAVASAVGLNRTDEDGLLVSEPRALGLFYETVARLRERVATSSGAS